MFFPSPLRYPGGKKKLAKFITDAIIQNDLLDGTYIEPFAGGASVALYLLFMEYMNNIIINDVDRSIYAFWFSLLNNTDELCSLIEDTPITMEEWTKQKSIQQQKDTVDCLSLGFSTFFLNRTNRSGIIKGGVIGGKGQAGTWKMDVRYNKVDLINRIRKIVLYKNRIQVFNQDAMDFVNDMRPTFNKRTLVYFDPPYYNQGAALYANHYSHEDHAELSRFIQALECNWILTYDYTPDVINLYHDVEKRLLTLNYTASSKVKGNEMIAFCKDFIIPNGNYPSISIE